jgi:hypothetical protein
LVNSSDLDTMHTNKLCLALLITLFISKGLLAAEFLRSLGIGTKPNYEVITGDEAPVRISFLLKQAKLNANQQTEIANHCLQFPGACSQIDLFKKVDVNLCMQDQKSFVYTLYRQGVGKRKGIQEDSYNLFLDAMEEFEINPHLKMNNNNTDLALSVILESNDNKLIDEMMRLHKFDPNTTYGEKKYPLVTVLILSKKYELAHKVASHSNFKRGVRDSDNFRPGYYLLKNYEGEEERKLFFELMKKDLSQWEMRGLGLGGAHNFDKLFKEILKENPSRLKALYNVLIQSCIWKEGSTHGVDKRVTNIVKQSFFNEFDNPKEYIDWAFSRQALEMMMYLGLISNVDENGYSLGRYWFQGLPDINRHEDNKIAKEGSRSFAGQLPCAACQKQSEEESELFISNVSCNHACCSSCFFSTVDTDISQPAPHCPVKGCDAIIAPSPFYSFKNRFSEDWQKVSAVTLAYNLCIKKHERNALALKKSINGFMECPNCSRGMILKVDTDKTRLIHCTCGNKYILSKKLTDTLIPCSVFSKLAVCGECEVPVDLVKPIPTCPHCNKQTTWLSLDQ